MSEYPECEKFADQQEQRVAVAGFLEWLQRPESVLCLGKKVSDEIDGLGEVIYRDDEGEIVPGWGDDTPELWSAAWDEREEARARRGIEIHKIPAATGFIGPCFDSIETVLCEYFETDCAALEKERRAMLAEARSAPATSASESSNGSGA